MNRSQCQILSFISILIFLICGVVIESLISSIKTSILIVSILWGIWNYYAWRFLNLIPYLKDFFPPYIGGKWHGHLLSSYNSIEKEVTVTIEQLFFSCKICIETDEITSESLCSSWVKDGDLFYLYYIYRTSNKRRGNYTNPFQRGTARLHLEQNNLIGDYWTSVKTNGELTLFRPE